MTWFRVKVVRKVLSSGVVEIQANSDVEAAHFAENVKPDDVDWRFDEGNLEVVEVEPFGVQTKRQ